MRMWTKMLIFTLGIGDLSPIAIMVEMEPELQRTKVEQLNNQMSRNSNGRWCACHGVGDGVCLSFDVIVTLP